LSGGRLQGKVAVVTGASSGIGAAVARALNAEGAHVALAARREDVLLEVQAELATGDGQESIVVPADVTDGEQVRALVGRSEGLGPVEMLVNCAGVMYYTLLKNVREEEWERTVEVNCKGALNCVGAVLPGMLERGRGHIVTISSDAGRNVFPGLSVYSASKFFVEALSQGLRLETTGMGLKVTTVQPGNVATELLALDEHGRGGARGVWRRVGGARARPGGRGGVRGSRARAARARRRKRDPGPASRRAGLM
jgi:NADP-dependent 3-hydroxy acid dehydrogenase YdfG